MPLHKCRSTGGLTEDELPDEAAELRSTAELLLDAILEMEQPGDVVRCQL
jgi:hypothetical protein